MRRTVAIVIGVLILLGIVAFGVLRLGALRSTSLAAATIKPTSCADAYRVLKLSPSQIAAAGGDCLNQTLQVTGELNGAVAQAYTVSGDTVDAAGKCSEPKRWSGSPQALLAIVVGKKAYRLRISAPGSSEHQGLTLVNLQGHVELASIADPSADWNQATGKVTLNADGMTGTIDANLLRDVSGTRGIHITGQWACGVPAAATYDATVPCAGFYALNHLQDADVARMKAQACNPQNLTFSGDIVAHLDHAITDTAIPAQGGPYGDNSCDAVGNQYDAALKFSIGDESFLLDLNPRSPSDSAIGPGQYAAGSGPFSANAFLWLGQADPSQNGLFVIDGGLDPGVSWFGNGGSFTIGSDMKSGTIDETFEGVSSDHADSTVHITGSWRCAP
jgi:hypothetical protein